MDQGSSLAKQRWLAPVRRPLTFSATSSGQFYLTPDPFLPDHILQRVNPRIEAQRDQGSRVSLAY